MMAYPVVELAVVFQTPYNYIFPERSDTVTTLFSVSLQKSAQSALPSS